MTDEKKLNIEEYNVTEEGGVNEYNEQLSPISDSASRKPWKGKKLLLSVILVVAIIVFYHILSWYSHMAAQKGVKEEQEVARKTQQSMVAQPRATELLAAAPTVTPAHMKSPFMDSAREQDMQNKLNILANRVDSNSQQLEKLQDGLLKSQATLAALNQTVESLSSSISDATKQIQQLNTPKPKPKKIKKAVKPRPPKAVYHVKAIVPGLAWLESSSGETASVRVGEKLEGYGVVQLISPQQGMVITSNGSVIQYGVNDF